MEQTMKCLMAIIWAATTLMGQAADSYTITEDLSNQNLSSVPRDLPETVESLDLSCNHIHHLHLGDFKNTPQLNFLNLSWNELESIDPQTFRDLPLFEYLDLSHNRLENLRDQQYLVDTIHLLVLNLAYNRFSVMTLGSEFSSLSKLKELSVGAKNISVGDFKHITALNLSRLFLGLENDCTYEAGSLQDVHSRRLQLAFAHNHVDLSIVADGLSFFDELEMMDLTGNYAPLIEQLRERQEVRTSRLYMTNSTIKWDDLTDYTKAVLNTSITYLTAADVVLTKLPYFDTVVSQKTNLKSFRVSRAEVRSVLFSQEAVYNFFINMPVPNLAIVDTPIIHMTCPKLQSPVVRLDFSNCALSGSIFSRVDGRETVECETLANVRTLILTGNNLKNLQVLSIRVQHMRSLQHVDLSLNSLTYNGLGGCVWPANISNVNLSFNGLTDSIFKCLPKRTKLLDLQNNQVSVVPPSILMLENLLVLDLTANRLRDLPQCHRFPNLNLLRLKANSLHAPSVTNLDSCPNLKVLDISVNPFVCTCAIRSFQQLGSRSTEYNGHRKIHLLRWPKAYHCTYPEAIRGSTIQDFSISEVSCNVGLLAATILVPAVVVIITVVTVCHRLDIPWYMGMIWQWTRAKHRARISQARPEDLVGVEFHAFVSYSQRDAEWVHTLLLPNLEGPAGGLRICHHERDFVPGKTIIQNIIGCMEKSRRTVFVLSAHFVKSEWCHYELYFATQHQLSRGQDSVVLVLLEPLPEYLIPSKYYQLKAMMKRHTYLEWPQDRAKHRLFWANLRAALDIPLPHAQKEAADGVE